MIATQNETVKKSVQQGIISESIASKIRQNINKIAINQLNQRNQKKY